MKKLILNADDFGPSEFINKGIREGIRAGVISSVSTFVTFGEKNLNNIRALKAEFGDKVKIGLHFTLTAGAPTHRPVEEVNKLRGRIKDTNDYKFWLLQYLKINRIKKSIHQVELELRSQIKVLADILGGEEHINHINSHVGILSMDKRFWAIAIKVAKEKNIPMRSPAAFEYTHRYLSIKDGKPFLAITRQGLLKGMKVLFTGSLNLGTLATLIAGSGRKAQTRRKNVAKSKGVKMPDCYVMSYYRQPTKKIIQWIIEHIEEGETVELLLHPGRGDYSQDNDWGIDPKSLTLREKELDKLLSVDLPKLLSDNEVKLTHYRD